MVKRRSSSRALNVYANLSHRRKTRRDANARRKAENRARLPKHPVERFFYRLHPKRFWSYWLSREGGIMALKVSGVAILFVVLAFGALFAYYRKDLDQIRPSELAKRVQTTVTKYYDRNNKLLWEDKGDGDYKLVVDGKDINRYVKQATIAIEDKDFYYHKGISFQGLIRATINNAGGGSTQGGSTLTQQLVKQVFFADEAQKRGLNGVPRKIKEVILAIEVERMYDKEQILNLYLNESPYGGRRNGVESAAQTYFGKHAKELTLAEASLLAAIPQNPSLYNPYNTAGNKDLIGRQHRVLDNMVEQRMITQKEADAAKKVAILDTINPEADQFKDIKAPHFVQMVRNELEQRFGKATVGRGGLVVKTTLDLDIQNKLEEEMTKMFGSYWPRYAGFTNGAGVIEDVRTGQIVALVGSRDFRYPDFGQDNAAVAFIQPGSSIKPLVYAKLFENKGTTATNYGSGSILADTPTTFEGNYKPQNADGGFKGNVNLRSALALSRNIPAIKAMAVSGVQPTLKTIRELGDTEYCTQGAEKQVGLASAIGGCGTRMVDHANALASLGRMGVYMPHSSVLEVKNAAGEVLQRYKEEQKKVVDPQAAYIVNEILGDGNARRGLFGRSITPTLDAAGIKTAIKTGTSDINKQPKDIWTIGYTPSLAGTVWLGNPDTRPLANGNSSIPAQVLDPVLAFATKHYQDKGIAKAGEWFTRPAGIQVIGNELYPSYYNKKQAISEEKLVFDRVSKKRPTACTPEAAKIELVVSKIKDPVTKKDVYLTTDGYDATKEDDVHKCEDLKPTLPAIACYNSGPKKNSIDVTVAQGTFPLQTLTVNINGQAITNLAISAGGTYNVPYKFEADVTVTASATDSGYYSGTSAPKSCSD